MQRGGPPASGPYGFRPTTGPFMGPYPPPFATNVFPPFMPTNPSVLINQGVFPGMMPPPQMLASTVHTPFQQPLPLYGGVPAMIAPTSSIATVYVGSISPLVSEEAMKKLLDECGRVLRWNRTIDPKTSKPAAFGFCEFESPVGAHRAFKLLNDSKVGDREIKVNCQEKIKMAIAEWRNSRLAAIRRAAPAKSLADAEGEIEADDVKVKISLNKLILDLNETLLTQGATEGTSLPTETAAAAAVPTSTTLLSSTLPPVLPTTSTTPSTAALASTTRSVSPSSAVSLLSESSTSETGPSNSTMVSKETEMATKKSMADASQKEGMGVAAEAAASVRTELLSSTYERPSYLSRDYRPHWRERDREQRLKAREKEFEQIFLKREKEWERIEESIEKERQREKYKTKSLTDEEKQRLLDTDARRSRRF